MSRRNRKLRQDKKTFQNRTAIGVSELGNAFAGWTPDTFFQRNLKPVNHMAVAALQAAISAHASAFSLMPLTHKRALPLGGYAVVEASALTRWAHRPNGFQTLAEFWSNGVRCLLETGNAVAVAARDKRGDIAATVWASQYSPLVDPDTGMIFYRCILNDGLQREESFVVPKRDVMHLRINAPIGSPLCGRSPIVWCASSLAVNAQLSAFLTSYLQNRASPSYALATDAKIGNEQIKQLRAAWEEQSQRIASGGTPILTNGLKPVTLGAAPGDELLVSTFNLTVEDVARAFNMPRALLGISETAANAAELMKAWISLGLGSLVEMVEQALGRLFDLPASEFPDFDHTALMRLDAEAQVRMVAQGATAGVLSADEARAVLGMPPVEGGYGRIPTVQQQQIPLNLLAQLHAANIADRLPDAVNSPAKLISPADVRQKMIERLRVIPTGEK